MKSVLVVFLLLTSAIAHGYDHTKCMTWKSRGYYGVVGLFLSSSSFFSSTGACAMLGSKEERKIQFITLNEERFRNDSARGSGEYLAAYSKLLGCNSMGESKLSSEIQLNYSEVFYGEPENIYNKIEKIKSSSEVLKQNCYF